MNNSEKYLSPWIQDGKYIYQFYRISVSGKSKFVIYNLGASRLPYTFEYPYNRYFESVTEAKDEFDRLLVLNGYTILTQDQYEKYLLLQ